MENCDNDQECEKIVPGEITPEPLPIPGGGGGTSDFNQLDNRPKYGGVKMSGATDIPNTEALIPAAASGQNQLADKNFVNSSVATNTANFVGTFSTIEELEAVQDPTNNDYGFVISTDASGNTVYNRYKYRSADSTWAFEYALNNSSFTADQWAAIQSGITSGDVSKLQGLAEIKSVGTGLDLDAEGVLTAKIYTGTGSNEDGGMTQKAASDSFGRRVAMSGYSVGSGLKSIYLYLTNASGNAIDYSNSQHFGVDMNSGLDFGYTNAQNGFYYVKGSAFTGATSQDNGKMGMVPVPTTADVDKFLKGDGTWGSVSAGLPVLDAKDYTDDTIQIDDIDPGVYKITYTGSSNSGMVYNGTKKLCYVTKDQTAILMVAHDKYNAPHKIGLAFTDEGSNTDPTEWLWVNSYNQTATNGRTRVIFNPNTNNVQIGASATAGGNAVAIGQNAYANGDSAVAIGGAVNSSYKTTASEKSVAFGYAAKTTSTYSVALGVGAKATDKGEVNMGTSNFSNTGGYNNTPYRLIRGIHPGEQDHDVTTLGQLNSRIIGSGASAPTTSTAGEVSSLYAYVENTTGHLAICTEVDTTDPDNPVYTWQTLV